MMRCLNWLGALLVCVLLAQAQGPDDLYVRIYYLIQEADTLNEKGETQQALTRYLEAQSALRRLKMGHPDWNEKVVNFRLNYLASKIDPLMQRVPAAQPAQPSAPSVQPGPAAAPEPASPPVSAPAAEPLQALQDQIARLTAQNALLEAKLKEAWSVQPPGTDPRELEQARQRIQELEKERDLLRVTLEQEKARWTNAVDAATLAQERQILAELQQRLAGQEQRSAALAGENQQLRQQNTELKQQAETLARQNQTLTQQVAELNLKLAAAPAPASPAGPEAALLANLQASNLALRTELLLMESRLADVVREAAVTRTPKQQKLQGELDSAKAAVRELQRERDKLRKQLDRLTRELAKRGGSVPAPPPDDTERQLEIARARLAAYEAKAVPYTPEELALFRQREVKLAANLATPAPRKKPHELPPGAGPLIAEAERAVDAGRFADAEQKYLLVLQQDEKNLYTLTHLAAVQLDQDRLADAERTLQRALAIDPQDPAVLYLLGSLRFRQERFDEALTALSQSAQVNPDKPQTQLFLGKVLIEKGQRAAAETALRKAIELRPGWAEPHALLAVLYATQQPPFKELAAWHYQKSRAGGAPRNPELEALLDRADTRPAGGNTARP